MRLDYTDCGLKYYINKTQGVVSKCESGSHEYIKAKPTEDDLKTLTLFLEQFNNIPNLFKASGGVNNNIFRKGQANHQLGLDVIKFFEDRGSNNIKLSECVYLIGRLTDKRPTCGCTRNGSLAFLSMDEGYRRFCGTNKVCSRYLESKTQDFKRFLKNETVEDYNKRHEKKRETIIERYGVDNYFKLPEFIENNYSEELVAKRNKNRVEAVMKKYGVDNVRKSNRFKESVRRTSMERYGVTNHRMLVLNEDARNKLSDKDWLTTETQKYSISHIAKSLSCDFSTVASYITKHDIDYMPHKGSAEEMIVKDILQELGVSFEDGSKKFLDNRFEIDFLLHEYKIGIEVNGLYWHSEKRRDDPMYHQNKTDECLSKGYKLIHIWDSDINKKLPQVTDLIMRATNNIINDVDVTSVSTIDYMTYKNFIDLNSLTDGEVQNVKSFGVYNDGDLIAVFGLTYDDETVEIHNITQLIGYNVMNIIPTILKQISIECKSSDMVIEYVHDTRLGPNELLLINNFKLEDVYGDPTTYYTFDFETLHTEQPLNAKRKVYKVHGCKPTLYKF